MIPPPQSVEKQVILQQVKVGADWFNWIAGLSVVNSVLVLANTKWQFMFGLALTEAVDQIGNDIGGTAKIVGFVISLLIAGMFVLFGMKAKQGKIWAFVTGMVIYGLDGILMVVFQEYISAAVHAYALFRIFGGFQAAQQLKALVQNELQQPVAVGVAQPGVWPPPPNSQ